MTSKTITIEIKNELGLHARPAAAFVRTASRFSSEILVEKGSEKVNGKSLVNILMLAAGHRSQLRITATGSDCDDAIAALKIMAESNKDFTEK